MTLMTAYWIGWVLGVTSGIFFSLAAYGISRIVRRKEEI